MLDKLLSLADNLNGKFMVEHPELWVTCSLEREKDYPVLGTRRRREEEEEEEEEGELVVVDEEEEAEIQGVDIASVSSRVNGECTLVEKEENIGGEGHIVHIRVLSTWGGGGRFYPKLNIFPPKIFKLKITQSAQRCILGCTGIEFISLAAVVYTVVVHVMDRLDNINNYIITVVQYLLLLCVHESLLSLPNKNF